MKLTPQLGIFELNIDPNRVEMGWKVILDAIRFILAKYEPVPRHGDLSLRMDRWAPPLSIARRPPKALVDMWS